MHPLGSRKEQEGHSAPPGKQQDRDRHQNTPQSSRAAFQPERNVLGNTVCEVN